jgi:hypothetical protein
MNYSQTHVAGKTQDTVWWQVLVTLLIQADVDISNKQSESPRMLCGSDCN